MPRDTTAPIARIDNPASGATVLTSTVNIAGAGVDAVGVTSLKLYVNNTLVASSTYAASKNTTRYINYTYTFPSDGAYTIKCEARDGAGNLGTKSISIVKSSTTTTTSSTTAPPAPPVLPSSKILATPTAFNQGGEGSCLSMTVALARSIEQYYTTGATSYSQSVNIFSPEFHYDNCKLSADCGSGATMLNGLNFIYGTGICRWSVLPYSDQNGCDVSLCTPATYTDAANYKLVNYRTCSTSDLYAVKRHICNNHPGMFTFQMDKNYYDGGNGDCNYIWNSRGYLMFSHAITIVGYDDAKQAWLLQNSYGPTWGCNGRLWVSYSFLATITSDIYFMTLRNDQNYFPII